MIMMNKFALPLTAFALAAMPLPVQSADGPIDTLVHGSWVCEWPGDASERAGIPDEAMSFLVVNGSTYTSNGKRGRYLVAGRTVRMTSGPLAGARFERVSDLMLRRVDEKGDNGRLRCVRRGRG